MNSVPPSAILPTSTTSDANRVLAGRAILLRRAIESVRDLVRGSGSAKSVAQSSAGASAGLASSAPVRPAPPRESGTAVQTIGRILLAMAVLAAAGCMLLALIGLYANSSREPKGV